MQHCDHCNTDKIESDFYPYAPRKCKACFKAYRQWYEKAFPEKVAAKGKRRWERNKDRYLERNRNNKRKQTRNPDYKEKLRLWRTSHLIEWNVKARVRTAVKNGSLTKPDCCSKCGYKCSPQAHHEDYAKPYDVQWLCASCHKRRHKEMDALGIAPLNGSDSTPPDLSPSSS